MSCKKPSISIRESGKKAYVALLDAKKPFDTVWHQGLFVKLHRKGIPTRIWHILNNWYTSSSCSVLQCGNHSKSFLTLQGVHQGAILSPLLYCIFVDDLLNTLEHSGLIARIGEAFCGSPMYTDDLALVASSPEELQAMLDIVSHYASQWRYQLNCSKSVILVLGESRLAPDLVAYIQSPPIDSTQHSHFPSCSMDVSYGLYLKPNHLCWNMSTGRS